MQYSNNSFLPKTCHRNSNFLEFSIAQSLQKIIGTSHAEAQDSGLAVVTSLSLQTTDHLDAVETFHRVMKPQFRQFRRIAFEIA